MLTIVKLEPHHISSLTAMESEMGSSMTTKNTEKKKAKKWLWCFLTDSASLSQKRKSAARQPPSSSRQQEKRIAFYIFRLVNWGFIWQPSCEAGQVGGLYALFVKKKRRKGLVKFYAHVVGRPRRSARMAGVWESWVGRVWVGRYAFGRGEERNGTSSGARKLLEVSRQVRKSAGAE